MTAENARRRVRSAAIDGAPPRRTETQNLGRHGSVVASMTFCRAFPDWRATWCVSSALLRRHTGRGRILRRVPQFPNFFRRLFAEGAFSQAFVPVLAGYRNRDPITRCASSSRVMGGKLHRGDDRDEACSASSAAPLFVIIFAPGLSRRPGTARLTRGDAAHHVPVRGFISLTAFAGAAEQFPSLRDPGVHAGVAERHHDHRRGVLWRRHSKRR